MRTEFGQMRSSKFGQFSIEFLIVIGCLLIVLASVSIPMYNQARADAQRSSDLAEAREAAGKIANTLNSVYSGGVGSKQTVEYWLPKKILEILVDETVDGTGSVPSNGRVDVQIWLDWDDDGVVDNIVLVDTILPSTHHANWQEYQYPVINGYLSFDSGNRTFHRVIVEYKYPQIEIEEA